MRIKSNEKIKLLKKNLKNKNSVSNTLFDKLPLEIRMKILQLLDCRSLMEFSFCFPQYFKITLQSKFWIHVDLLINDKLFNFKEVNLLLNKYGKNFKMLRIDLYFFKEPHTYEKILKCIPNVKSLEIKTNFRNYSTELISDISLHIKNLQELNINWDKINNENLIFLANNFPKLKCLNIFSYNDITEGCLYVIDHLDKIESFGLCMDDINNK